MSEEQIVYVFRRQGHYTVFDNALLDYIMPLVTPSEWLIICSVVRKTVGWHKDEDEISLSQLASMTGLGRRTVARAVKNLCADKDNPILIKRTKPAMPGPNTYSLNHDYSVTMTPLPWCHDDHDYSVTMTPTKKRGNKISPTARAREKNPNDERLWIEFLLGNSLPVPKDADEWAVLKSPGSVAWLKVTEFWPGWLVLGEIAESLGKEPDRGVLNWAWRKWALAGYNPKNVDGVLDWYGHRLKDSGWLPRKKNGAGKPAAVQDPRRRIADEAYYEGEGGVI